MMVKKSANPSGSTKEGLEVELSGLFGTLGNAVDLLGKLTEAGVKHLQHQRIHAQGPRRWGARRLWIQHPHRPRRPGRRPHRAVRQHPCHHGGSRRRRRARAACRRVRRGQRNRGHRGAAGRSRERDQSRAARCPLGHRVARRAPLREGGCAAGCHRRQQPGEEIQQRRAGNPCTQGLSASRRGQAMKDTGQSDGQYLYAVIACTEPREFTARGIGERGDVVHTVNYRRLAAVVSNSPNVEYESSRRNMMAHTLVLEEVMEQFDLLPVRFGTIAPAAGSVEPRLLAPRYQEFTELLEQMRGRIEVGLKAFWYEGAAVAEVVRENETIRRMRDALNGRSPTETYYERIRLGEEVEHALAQKRTRDEETILARIRPLVHKTRTNKIVSDRMVVNAAFLVDRQNGLQLDDAVRRLSDEFNDRLMFKYFGPVPPYNFVNIVVNWEG